MRTVALILLSLGTLAAQPVLSPEVHADRTVTFRLRLPNAQKVQVGLEGQARQEMTKGEDRVWTLTTAALEPDLYGYSFIVDGTSFVDPSHGQIKTNALSVSSAVLVPGDPPMPWEQTSVPHGVVRHHFFESKIAGDQRDFYVYTPPAYDASKAYPLLVLLHGYSDYADGWTTVGKANLILDNLIAKGEVKPMIVLMTLGYGVNINVLRTGITRDPDLWKSNAQKYGEILLQEVLPLAEKAYRIDPKRTSHAIAGLSMGGGESLLVGLNHLDRFAYVGAFSAGGSAGNPDEVYPQLSEKDNARLKLLWIACGKDDRLMEPNRKFVEWLNGKKVKNTFLETPGAHTWLVWRRYLADFTKQLKW
ncbi:MAG: esterase [Fimbriimonas ginsengisoli]|nr:esterase [Fimbriimonas ginsengisoli]